MSSPSQFPAEMSTTGDTVDFDHIKRHYYMTHHQLNPSRIVPPGPIVDWSAPHSRDALP